MTAPTIGMRVMPIVDIPSQQPAGRVQVATVDQIRAALDLGHVVEIVVFCDCCNSLHRADYIGETKDIRLATARAWLVQYDGWTCDSAGDYCPDCTGGLSS